MVRSEEVASGGWQQWRTSESHETWSLREEGRKTNDESTKKYDSQRAQSSNDVWISNDEGTHHTAIQTIEGQIHEENRALTLDTISYRYLLEEQKKKIEKQKEEI